MAGQICSMIQKIVAQKSRGNVVIANGVKTKMFLSGINVDKYTAISPDDPKIIAALRAIAKEYGITL